MPERSGYCSSPLQRVLFPICTKKKIKRKIHYSCFAFRKEMKEKLLGEVRHSLRAEMGNTQLLHLFPEHGQVKTPGKSSCDFWSRKGTKT